MNITGLHWRTVKKLVEENGGSYTTAEAAAEFLAPFPDLEPAPAPAPAPKIMLDRSLPFGTISGEMEECPGARYAQNGHLFDGTGLKVG